jgi:hypothetical protein
MLLLLILQLLFFVAISFALFAFCSGAGLSLYLLRFRSSTAKGCASLVSLQPGYYDAQYNMALSATNCQLRLKTEYLFNVFVFNVR